MLLQTPGWIVIIGYAGAAVSAYIVFVLVRETVRRVQEEALIKILPRAGGDLGLYVAQALGELNDRGAVPALIDEIKRSEEPELRGIAEALGRLGDPEAVPALMDLLKTGKDVRYAAAVALSRLGDSRAIETLRKVRDSDPQAFVREAAASALKRLDAGAPAER